MATTRDHYESLLAEHYSAMFGDFDGKVAEQATLLGRLGVDKAAPRRALDLGCGSGFQSIALAKLGFDVTAVDFSRRLLDELSERSRGLPVQTVVGDLAQPADIESRIGTAPFGVAVCMGDTLTHLATVREVAALFAKVADWLTPGGLLVLTWRDLSQPHYGVDRFIPVVLSDERMMTCFLDHDRPDSVLVHDLVHARGADGAWQLSKSSYRKLRLSPDVVGRLAEDNGFIISLQTLPSACRYWPAGSCKPAGGGR